MGRGVPLGRALGHPRGRSLGGLELKAATRQKSSLSPPRALHPQARHYHNETTQYGPALRIYITSAGSTSGIVEASPTPQPSCNQTQATIGHVATLHQLGATTVSFYCKGCKFPKDARERQCTYERSCWPLLSERSSRELELDSRRWIWAAQHSDDEE